MLTTRCSLEEATKSLIHLVLFTDCRSANLRSVPKRQVSLGRRCARVSPLVLTITLHHTHCCLSHGSCEQPQHATCACDVVDVRQGGFASMPQAPFQSCCSSLSACTICICVVHTDIKSFLFMQCLQHTAHLH